MKDKIINPFKYVAGVTSFITGIIIISATAITGYFSKTHFPDIISVKTCPGFSIWYFFLQGFSNWIVLSLILYLIAVIFSKSSVRAVDIFGTQAVARFPYLIASFIGFSDSINKFGQYILWTYMQNGAPVDLSAPDVVIAIILMVLTLALTIWLVILMFNAFRVSANIKGSKSIVLFIVAFISSIVITHYISNFLIFKFS
ncbi:MAG: hypothetical protein LLG13_07895 [Bacteroidales bacterium]|nr:hypothetical protein [Bacteroidales bacterium]